MYEVKAQIDPIDADRILDELVVLFETHHKDCTCGLVDDLVIGYVEEDMLSRVTTTILRHTPQVSVQIVEDEEVIAV